MTEQEEKWDEWMRQLVNRVEVLAVSDRANVLRSEDRDMLRSVVEALEKARITRNALLSVAHELNKVQRQLEV